MPSGSADADAAADHPRSASRFVIGEWLVDVASRRLHRGEEALALEPLHMAVLAMLCRHAGSVLRTEDLLDACWAGVAVGDNPVHKTIALLRRALGDSAAQPRYIETIRKQGYRLIAPTRVLFDEGARGHRGSWRGRSPFCGLEPFGAGHASVFFGRDAEIAELRDRLGHQWRSAHPLVLLLGPSGSGKTSLVQAGLLPALLDSRPVPGEDDEPALRACAAACLDVAALAGQSPEQALAGAMLDWEVQGIPLLSGHSVDSLAELMRSGPDQLLTQLRAGLDATVSDRQRDRPALLVLDRLEALFQPQHATAAQPLLALLERLMGGGLFMTLAVCRNDFYPSVAKQPLLMRGKEHGAHMDLAPPGAESIAQIIRLPASAAGLSYGSDTSGLWRLDDRLCADAMRASDALPLLQYTLQALYAEREPGDVLTWEAYDALGGLDGAVGRRAETVLSSRPAAEQEALGPLLARLIVLGSEEAGPTGRWVDAADLETAAERELVQALVDARLLVADQSGGRGGIRVAHEALLRRWPRVTAWVARHREVLAVREELLPWERRWREGDQAKALLLPRGTEMWRARAALAAEPALFDDSTGQFVRASLARLRRQRQWRVAAGFGVGALALVAGAAALRNGQLAAIAKAREEQSLQLVSFLVGDLADQLRPLGKLDLLGRVGEQGLEVLSHPTATDTTPRDILQRAKALVVIGEVNSTRGKGRVETATAALRQAWQLLEPLERDASLPRADYYRTLGASAFWLGQMAFDAGDWERAQTEMQRYRAASERWRAAMPDDAQAGRELGYAVGALGSIALKRGVWAEAERWFRESLELSREALARVPNDPEAIDGIVSAQTWLGQLATMQGRPTEGLVMLDGAVEAVTRLLEEHPEQALRLRDLGTLHLRRADALQALGQGRAAVLALEAGLSRFDEASRRDVGNQRWHEEALNARAVHLFMLATQGVSVGRRLQAMRSSFGADLAGTTILARKSALRVEAAESEMAATAADWPLVLSLAERTGRSLQEFLARQPYSWHERRLQAAMFLLELRARTALKIEDRDRCSHAAAVLQPAVQSGLGDLVLEAWLHLRQCAGQGAIDAAAWQRLTVGGYQPLVPPTFSTPTTSRSDR
ncbi:nSTAND1 domain-containing NTPase [Ideonella sp. YS5]|uniref:nSTAND1 domain-containing NTPase n=1 Tax=Ideonella sp. YS5 TaxID=3453714 RepID=UPI003F72B1AA